MIFLFVVGDVGCLVTDGVIMASLLEVLTTQPRRVFPWVNQHGRTEGHMPLVATLAGERVVSIDLTPDEWDSLKNRYRAGEPLLMSCGQPGSARVSSRA